MLESVRQNSMWWTQRTGRGFFTDDPWSLLFSGAFSRSSHGHPGRAGVLSRQSDRLFGPPTGNAGHPPGTRFLAMNPNRHTPAVRRLLALFAITLALASAASAEWKEKVLYSFQGGSKDGSAPVGAVVFDKQGNLYGATMD